MTLRPVIGAAVLMGLSLNGPAMAREWQFGLGDGIGVAYIEGESGFYALQCTPGDTHWVALLAVAVSGATETFAIDAERAIMIVQADTLPDGLKAEAVTSTAEPGAIGFVAGVAQSWVDEILQSEEMFLVGIAKDADAAAAGDLAVASELSAAGHVEAIESARSHCGMT